MSGDHNMFATFEPPKIVGYWVMPGSNSGWHTKFGAYEKPNWFHRTMMRCCLGWKWEDA